MPRKPEKTKGSAIEKFLVESFTGDNWNLLKKYKYNMELVFYDYYKLELTDPNMIMFGVKSEVCDVGELPKDTINEAYNQYVTLAKKSGKPYGVSLEFYYEIKENKKPKPQEDIDGL